MSNKPEPFPNLHSPRYGWKAVEDMLIAEFLRPKTKDTYEISLHSGPPEGVDGEPINELDYKGYKRLRAPILPVDETTMVCFPTMQGKAVSLFCWALLMNGKVMYYQIFNPLVHLTHGDVVTIPCKPSSNLEPENPQ